MTEHNIFNIDLDCHKCGAKIRRTITTTTPSEIVDVPCQQCWTKNTLRLTVIVSEIAGDSEP